MKPESQTPNSDYANTKMLAAALGVSAGVMLYVSFVEIFAIKSVDAFEAGYPGHGDKLATLCFFTGIMFTFCLDALVHKIGEMQKRRTGKAAAACVCHADPADFLTAERAVWSDAEAATHPITVEKDTMGLGRGVEGDCCDDHAEHSSTKPPLPPDTMSRKDNALGLFANSHDTIDGVNAATEAANKEHLQNMGLMTGLAIFLHNFPEGLATFVAALADSRVGVALAVAIAVHNIPEGICVAMVRS